jgi:hypothetical protein
MGSDIAPGPLLGSRNPAAGPNPMSEAGPFALAKSKKVAE